jgi:hypothetical protein
VNWFRGTWVMNQWRFVVNGAVVDNLLTAQGAVWLAIGTFGVKDRVSPSYRSREMFLPLNNSMNSNCSPYHEVNRATVIKSQSVNIVWGNNRCLFLDAYKTYIHCVGRTWNC